MNSSMTKNGSPVWTTVSTDKNGTIKKNEQNVQPENEKIQSFAES